jgi:hypothetical protein
MHSKAYRIFKKEVGQSNHFFITLYVGLKAIENGAKKAADIHEAWDPKNIKASVDRSLIYAKKATLAWVVDNLDVYFKLANKSPIIFDKDEKKLIDGAGRSIYNKFSIVAERYSDIDLVEVSFVDLLICWRNKMVHSDADNKLKNNSRECLQNIEKSHVVVSKYHMNISSMLERFDNGMEPTNKELETMISILIHFISHLDEQLLDKIDRVQYIHDLIKKDLKDNQYKFDFATRDDIKRLRQFRTMLKSRYCITDEFITKILDDEINKMAMMSKNSLLDYLEIESLKKVCK